MLPLPDVQTHTPEPPTQSGDQKSEVRASKRTPATSSRSRLRLRAIVCFFTLAKGWPAGAQLAMVPVVGTLPRRHRHRHRRQSIARVSVSALVASLPLLYLSLLRPPPAALAGDTAFWFLMSNCVIADKDDDDGPCDGRSLSDHHVSCSGGAAVGPLAAAAAAAAAASNNEPAVIIAMQGGGGVQEAVAASTVATGSNSMDLVAFAPPLLMIQAEDEDAAEDSKHRTDLPNQHMHVSALQRGEQHEAAIEPSTDKSSTAVTVVKSGQGEEDRPTHAPGRALAETPETEPERKSLPDQEEAADDEWQSVTLYESPPDQLAVHDKGVGAARDGRLSDEELNRRVEEFIARFNRQIEQEAGV